MPSLLSTALSLCALLNLAAADFYIVNGRSSFSVCAGLPVCGTEHENFKGIAATNAYQCIGGDLAKIKSPGAALGLGCKDPAVVDPHDFEVPIDDGICGIAGGDTLACSYNGFAGYSCALKGDPTNILATCGTDSKCSNTGPAPAYLPIDSAICVTGPGSSVTWEAILKCTGFGDKHLGIC